MSTLFALNQVALFGRDLGPADSDAAGSASTPSPDASAAEPAPVVGWSMPEPSSAVSTSQPARWRINSGDLEEMMLRAAVGLGLDKGSRSAASLLEDNNSSSPLSDLAEEQPQQQRGESVMGLPTPAPSTSRGSSPLYSKHAASDYQDHNLDTTAPSSPCTPSMHMRSLSAVSPTSSRSEEAAFQHQLSLEADSRVPTAVAAAQSTRPGVAAHAGGGGPGNNTSGRFGLKLLVSNSMAGTLIGKGGTRICEIKDECLADIKVTPNGRFYPGTHERVVLVVGEPGSVQMACDRIVTTIYTAADTSLDITQRVLIPDAASGLIIGHDGVRLGDLRLEAGVASIQVSPRDMCTVAGERVVTLQGAMSSVILGLTLIVDRMMEDTTASRYQNMSTIYRAVHLHLPPYAVPGGGMQQQQHDGSSPRHPHARLSPSYAGPSPHSQHDFHSPGAVAARGAAGRDYGNGAPGGPGGPHWEFGGYGGGNPPRELTPHGGGNGGGGGGGGGGSTAAEFVHRSMSMPTVHGHDGGSPADHRSHTAPGAHFGGRHMRQSGGGGASGGGSSDLSGRDFDFGEVDARGGRGADYEDCRREYDSPSRADLNLSRQGSRDGYLHHSPRLQGPSPRDFDHMRQQQHASEGSRGFAGNRGGFHGAGASQSEYLPLQHQQQRLRQQQQQQLARSSSEYSQEATAGMIVHEARVAAAAAAAAAASAQQQHRGLHEPVPSALQRSCSANMQGGGGAGGGGAGGSMGSPPHGTALRQCHSMTLAAAGGGGGGGGGGGAGHGDASGLSGMFDGMSLNSPHGLTLAPSLSSPGSLQQHQQQQQQQGQGPAGGNGGGSGCIVHGELPVPDADVGIILGKGGATVRELQQLSGAKIMIARRNEFMPGTKHRLVTLAGPPLAVNMARFLIMRKIQTEKEKL